MYPVHTYLIPNQATQQTIKADVARILLSKSPELAKLLLHFPGAVTLCLGWGCSGDSLCLHLGLGADRLCVYLVLYTQILISLNQLLKILRKKVIFGKDCMLSDLRR